MLTAKAADFSEPSFWILPLALIPSIGFLFPTSWFLWFYFINEHVLRYLNKRVPRDYDTVPLLLFWALLLVWLVPWIAFLPQALRQVPIRWRRMRSQLDREGRANLLFMLWALVIVVFFSFSTRQEYYTVPAIPAIALLVGGWLKREIESPANSHDRRAGVISSTVLFALGILVLSVGMFFVAYSRPPAPGMDISELLSKNPAEYKLLRPFTRSYAAVSRRLSLAAIRIFVRLFHWNRAELASTPPRPPRPRKHCLGSDDGCRARLCALRIRNFLAYPYVKTSCTRY